MNSSGRFVKGPAGFVKSSTVSVTGLDAVGKKLMRVAGKLSTVGKKLRWVAQELAAVCKKLRWVGEEVNWVGKMVVIWLFR